MPMTMTTHFLDSRRQKAASHDDGGFGYTNVDTFFFSDKDFAEL